MAQQGGQPGAAGPPQQMQGMTPEMLAQMQSQWQSASGAGGFPPPGYTPVPSAGPWQQGAPSGWGMTSTEIAPGVYGQTVQPGAPMGPAGPKREGTMATGQAPHGPARQPIRKAGAPSSTYGAGPTEQMMFRNQAAAGKLGGKRGK